MQRVIRRKQNLFAIASCIDVFIKLSLTISLVWEKVWYWECEIKLEADTTSVSSVPIPGNPWGIELCTIWGHYTNIYIMLEIRGWSEHFRDYFRYSQCLYSFLWKQGKVSGLYRVLELKYLFGNTYKSKLSGIDKYFLFWEMSVHYSFLLELYWYDVKNLF